MTCHDDQDPFHNIKLAHRCKVEWGSMKGDEVIRQCPECLLNVYNLSDITQEEARRLFAERERKRCTQLFRRNDGLYMPRNCPASMWRDLCGPSQNEIWRQVSDQIDAQCIATGTETDFGSRSKIKASHGPWIITLDTYMKSQGKSSVEMTRLRSPFVNPNGFRFTVYPKSIFSDMGKYLFGMQDIEIGHSHFDEQMIIQGTNEEDVRKLFSNTRIRELLLWHCQTNPTNVLTIKDDEGWWTQEFPKGVDELHFESLGLITNRDVLRRLVELFAETLDQLVRIGAAGIQDAGIDVT